jgi:hypothetical protein
MRDLTIFTMEVKEQYRFSTSSRRTALWNYQCRTEQLGVEMDDIVMITFLIDE